jgi:SAM-dependent methyltransferase
VVDERMVANQAMWDERVPIHVASRFYDVEGFKFGRPQLQPFEVEELGPLDGTRLCHLQCHFGLDTLDLARLHPTVDVTGVDFSAPALEAARRLATEVRVADRATFVYSDVYRTVDALEGQRFDVVYTGKGALNWLPDIDRWASIVHELLEPGGFLYVTEFHPVAAVLANDQPVPAWDYFSTEAVRFDEPGTYADPDARTVNSLQYEWQHPISQVITAVLRGGLALELFHEWDFTLYDEFPYLVNRRWPGPGTLPLMYSLKARRSVR